MCSSNSKESPAHFQGKDAVGHVIEAQAQGLAASSEIHGTEVPGNLAAFADAARETALILLLLWTILFPFHPTDLTAILIIFSASWAVWKLGRSALLGWGRLERLHRLLAQEKWEIEHHRQQERDELRELYRAKGFHDQLLEDVLDVLMADDNRLLRVMVEEELGLTLTSHEHPLKQGLGALFGALSASIFFILSIEFLPPFVTVLLTFFVIGGAGLFVAKRSQNRLIPAIIWNIGIALLSFCVLYFFLQHFSG